MVFCVFIAYYPVGCYSFMFYLSSALDLYRTLVIIVLPTMASIIHKKKGDRRYYYVVHSSRVNGKPRITKQTYLGTAEAVESMILEKGAPLPQQARTIEFGLPAALWLCAQRCGIVEALQSIWPQPRSAPSIAHYLLLAAIHRICDPGPKTQVEQWYTDSILSRHLGFDSKRFTSQAFWDAFDRIEQQEGNDELEHAQAALLGAWRERNLLSRYVLAYDTSNFHTWMSTFNERSEFAKRGRNKQKRHDLRQVGLSYVMDGEAGLSLCHKVYPGNLNDSSVLPGLVDRLVGMLDSHSIERESVTLVMDKGSASTVNTSMLEERGLGWISALPWKQAPKELREMSIEELEPLGFAHPGVSAGSCMELCHGREYLLVLKYSSCFAAEQMQSVVNSATKAMESMRRLNRELGRPGARYTEEGIRNRVSRYLQAQFVSDIVNWELERSNGVWRLNFSMDCEQLSELMGKRFGRTVLMSNRVGWSGEQVIEAYDGQQKIERVFRGLKNGQWISWNPMYHWTDSKIRVHAFYCMLGVSILQHLYAESAKFWKDLTMEKLLEELSGIMQFEILYPSQGASGPQRTAVVIPKRTKTQEVLAEKLRLDEILTSGR